MTIFRTLVLAAMFLQVLCAADKPPIEPKVTALVPLVVPQGFEGTVRIRGFRMKEATAVRADAKLTIKEKKDAGTPGGMSADLLGESEVVIELKLAADHPVGALALTVAIGDKAAQPVTLQVLPAPQLADEKEPNKGFRSAQKIEPGKSVNGLINGQRDVDTFEIAAKAGQTLRIEIIANGVGSLLDPLLTAYDAQGSSLGVQDDEKIEARDGILKITPKEDGPIFLTVQDALDFGSEWHSYRLKVGEKAAGEDQSTVSFANDVWPILRANCISCHRPGKLKGKLDLTSFAALSKGGKHGTIFEPGAPEDSELILSISGDEAEMPAEGEFLIAREIETLTRWVAQGALDDTPESGLGTRRPATPPVYHSLPAVPAIAFSPDGNILALAAHHEIIIHRGDGSEIIARWPGDSPRIEALQFSRDGKLLVACGGAPSEFGEIQIWDVASGKSIRSIRAGSDTLYGVSISDDNSRVAVGGADKLVRAFDVKTGEQVMQCDNHLDWVFGTAFVHDGSRLISGSRDTSLKLIDVSSGHLIDDAARPREPILALARHPTEDLVAFTGKEGKVRLHRMAPRGGRLKEGDNKEENAVREFEHMSTSLHAVAFNADGSQLACGGQSGEVRIFQTETGQRKVVIQPAGGAIFCLAFHPTENRLAAAGSDGQIRFYDASDGKLQATFSAVPLTAH